MTTATMPATTPGLKWSDQHQAALNGRAMLGNAGATVNADGRDSVWVRATDNTL